MRRTGPGVPVLRWILYALAVAIAAVPPVAGQWLDLVDSTATHLVLEPFSEDPFGDPYADLQEKDMAAGDLDRDGRTDLVVVRKRPFFVPGERQDLLLMNERGVLTDRTSLYAPGFRLDLTDARDVAVTDVDGDGWLDVVVANTFGEQPKLYRNAGAGPDNRWLGLVEESDSRLPPIEAPRDVDLLQFCGVAAGDLDGDERPELFFSNYRSAGGNRDLLLRNDGAGFFVNGTEESLGPYANVAFGTGAEVVDVDADGDRDLVKLSALYEAPPFPEGQFLLFNDGAGTFLDLPFQELPTAAPYMFATGDLDGNGLLDVYLQGDVQDRVLLAQSAEPDTQVGYTEVEMTSPRTAGPGGNTHLADLDGDGDLDAGVGPIHNDLANCGGNEVLALLENPGDGHLLDPWSLDDGQPFHLQAHDFAFLDIDGDGCTDLFLGLCEGWRVFLQEGCAALLDAPLGNLALRAGLTRRGDLESLRADDDDRLVIESTGPQGRPAVDIAVLAASPETRVSRLDLRIEAAASRAGVLLTVALRDAASGSWWEAGHSVLGPEETWLTLTDVAGGPGAVDPETGEVAMRLVARASSTAAAGGFRVAIDQVEVTILP